MFIFRLLGANKHHDRCFVVKNKPMSIANISTACSLAALTILDKWEEGNGRSGSLLSESFGKWVPGGPVGHPCEGLERDHVDDLIKSIKHLVVHLLDFSELEPLLIRVFALLEHQEPSTLLVLNALELWRKLSYLSLTLLPIELNREFHLAPAANSSLRLTKLAASDDTSLIMIGHFAFASITAMQWRWLLWWFFPGGFWLTDTHRIAGIRIMRYFLIPCLGIFHLALFETPVLHQSVFFLLLGLWRHLYALNVLTSLSRWGKLLLITADLGIQFTIAAVSSFG